MMIEEFENYLVLQRNYSKNTADSYSRDVKQFLAFYNRALNNISQNDVKDFLEYLGKEGLTVSSRNRKLSSLKRYFKFVLDEGVISTNPAINLEGGKQGKRLPKPIDPSDIAKLMSCVDNLRDKTLFEVLYATGVRREELAALSVSNIDFDSHTIRVIGKGNKERVVPIYPRALARVKELIDSHKSTWVFPSTRVVGNHISNRQVNEIVAKWVNRAGLEHKDITTHSFRHSFCSHLYANGADIKVIRDMAGHESTSTTEIYTKISTERNMVEYTKFHPGSI